VSRKGLFHLCGKIPFYFDLTKSIHLWWLFFIFPEGIALRCASGEPSKSELQIKAEIAYAIYNP
jgi:hypothetical protein